MNYEKIKQNSIEALLNSGEYKTILSDTLTSIIKKSRQVPNESDLSQVFDTELYYVLKSFFNVDITFQKEVGENIIGHKFTGRMDAVSNDLVIEYKHFSKLKTDSDKDKATNQVKDYLKQLYDEGNQYRGVLTDGIKIKYFYYQNGTLKHTPFSNIKTLDLDIIIKSLLNVKQKQFVPENLVNDFKLNTSNSPTKELARCLFRFLDNDTITDKTAMLFNEWEVLFHLSENDQGKNSDIEKRKTSLGSIFDTDINTNELEYKALFALQTTYAIIVKLIACKVISKITFNETIMYFSDLTTIDSEKLRTFLEMLEDGYSFNTGGIRNLLEGDFFSWYCSSEQWNSHEANIFIDIIKILEEYSNTTFKHEYEAVDIFKDLYMEIMPNEVRHSLGEYFTPSWLADYVVNNSIDTITPKRWKAIDPCCGSGIFIVTLIKKIMNSYNIATMSEKEKTELLFDILDRVKGIDINPLSVLTARVSFLLAISPLIGNNEFEIPVYIGDSANIPTLINLDDVPCYKYSVHTKKGIINVTLPCSFVKSSSFVEKMSYIQAIIKAEDSSLVYSRFIENIPQTERTSSVIESIQTLSEQLVDLHKNNWDGIWIRIVTNFMLVARINNMNIIVGNPPWVKWEFLPQKYAEKIKSICIDRHLFSGQTYMGAISLNICALISNVTASSWLSPDGVLAFLMPKTLMTQDSYAGFRNFYIDFEENKRLYLQKVDDWTKAGDPFIYTNEKFLTYYYSSQPVKYTTGLPINNIIKKRKSHGVTISIQEINKHRNFDEVKDYFNFEDGIAYQLDNNRTGFTMIKSSDFTLVNDFQKIVGTCEYKARSGVEFTPAEIYFIESYKKSNSNGTHMFKNCIFKNSKYKAIQNNGFELETKYIRPVIKSPYIKSFAIEDSNNYCIFPYSSNDINSIPISKLSNECMKLTTYLIKYKGTIGKQSKRSQSIAKGDDFYSLSKVGKYTFAEHLVVFRDNTSLVSAVVTPILTPWGEKVMPICAKHSPYISMDNKDRFITEDESYYICGILNTTVVQAYFKSTYSSRSFSINLNIKLPLFDNTNSFHTQIRDLSKQAHLVTSDEDKDKLIKKITEIYLEMCTNEKITNKEIVNSDLEIIDTKEIENGDIKSKINIEG